MLSNGWTIVFQRNLQFYNRLYRHIHTHTHGTSVPKHLCGNVASIRFCSNRIETKMYGKHISNRLMNGDGIYSLVFSITKLLPLTDAMPNRLRFFLCSNRNVFNALHLTISGKKSDGIDKDFFVRIEIQTKSFNGSEFKSFAGDQRTNT